jgi:hypothetical protein
LFAADFAPATHAQVDLACVLVPAVSSPVGSRSLLHGSVQCSVHEQHASVQSRVSSPILALIFWFRVLRLSWLRFPADRAPGRSTGPCSRAWPGHTRKRAVKGFSHSLLDCLP